MAEKFKIKKGDQVIVADDDRHLLGQARVGMIQHLHDVVRAFVVAGVPHVIAPGSGLQCIADLYWFPLVFLPGYPGNFTPLLMNLHASLRAKNTAATTSIPPFEVILISQCREATDTKNYFSAMPWTAMPHADASGPRGAALMEEFGVTSIPALILLDGEGVHVGAQADGAAALAHYRAAIAAVHDADARLGQQLLQLPGGFVDGLDFTSSHTHTHPTINFGFLADRSNWN